MIINKLIKYILILYILLYCNITYSINNKYIDIDIIAKINTDNNTNYKFQCYGKYGICAISEEELMIWNRNHENKYSKKDLFIEKISKEIMDWYLNEYIPKRLQVINSMIKNKSLRYQINTENILYYYKSDEWHMLNRYGNVNSWFYWKKYARHLNKA